MPMTTRQKRRLIPQIRELLCHPDIDVIGHNLKFDTMWLWAKTGIRICIRGDTLNLAAEDDYAVRLAAS